MISPLPRVQALRYLQPLREGGSLPAVMETELGLFVVKFRGAGQGPRALIAELVAALLARLLDLPVPEPALVDLPPGVGHDETDPEIRDLLESSRGLNMGLRYLDGAFNFDGTAAGDLISPELAAGVVWFDSYLTNPDRTPRNPNLMIWDRRPWLIDHGTALYAHHAWNTVDARRTRTPFPLIRDHILLLHAGDLREADARLSARLNREELEAVMNAVPEELLMDPVTAGGFPTAEAARARYVAYLVERLSPPRPFVDEMVQAQALRRSEPLQRLEIRR